MKATDLRPLCLHRAVHTAFCGGVTVFESAHPPRFELPRHRHDEAVLTLVLAGGFATAMRGEEHACGSLTLLFKPAGESHTEWYGADGARALIVGFEEAQLAAFAGGGLASLPPHRPPAALVPLAVELYRQLRLADAGVRLGAEELAWELLVRCRRRSLPRDGRPPRWLSRLRERLDAEPAAPFSLSQLAAELGLHPVYVARVFRRHTGCSVGEYLRRRRIDRATEQLAAGRMRPAQVAVECGFYDQSHLHRAFRRESGTSPGRFQRTARALLGCDKCQASRRGSERTSAGSRLGVG